MEQELKTTKMEQQAGDHSGTTPTTLRGAVADGATLGGVEVDATTLGGPGKVCAAPTHKMEVADDGRISETTGLWPTKFKSPETTELGTTGFGNNIIEREETTGLEPTRLRSTESMPQ